MNNPITEFYAWFKENANHLSIDKFPLSEEWLDAISDKIHQIDEKIWFEIGGDPKSNKTEFIFTASGDISKIEVVKSIVLQAPKLEMWTFIALKPPQSPEFITEWEGVKVEPRKVTITLMKPKGCDLSYGIRAEWPNFEINQKDITNALYIAVDTILGEEKSARYIKKIWCSNVIPPDERHGSLYDLMGLLDASIKST